MGECSEVAGNMAPPRFRDFHEAARWVRLQMPDETGTVVDNVAESLWLRQSAAE